MASRKCQGVALETLFKRTKLSIVSLFNCLPKPGQVFPVSPTIYPFLQNVLSTAWDLVLACRLQQFRARPYRRELSEITEYDFYKSISPCLCYVVRQLYPMVVDCDHYNPAFLVHYKCILDLIDGGFYDDEEEHV